MRRTLRRVALRLLAAPGVSAPFYPLMRGRAAVFMLHRFRNPDRGIIGDDPGELRAFLEVLRQRRYELVSLDDLFVRLRGDGRPLRRAVAFTIDDGYIEQAEIGAPVFAAYDCPVTTFVTSGFLDGKLWFWWDRIAYVFAHTSAKRVRLLLDGRTIEMEWTDQASRMATQVAFTERCKLISDTAKHAAIAALADAAAVQLPDSPPPGFAPMTWDMLRNCERGGMTFGPHTVTHPVLSRVTDDASHFELAESWARLATEARNPVKVFCYPNGGAADFGTREVETLRQLEFLGAVVGSWGTASVSAVARGGGNGAYYVRRFPFPGDLPNAIQYVSGIEHLKLALRGLDA